MKTTETGAETWCLIKSVMPLVAIPAAAFIGTLSIVLMLHTN